MAETKNVKRDSKGAQRLIMGAAGLFLGCLFLFPIYILVLNSFKNTKGIFTDVIGFPNAATFTLVNYPNAFEALEYIRSFVNSLTITVIATVLILLISSMAAWVLVRYKTKTSKIIFFLFAASMLIPFQCVMLPLVGFASRIGIMNPQGLIFMYMGFGSSMSIVMFHSFIKNIPEELEEAATIDGCGSVKTLWYVIVPMLKPSIVSCALFQFMWSSNDFMGPLLYVNTPARYPASIFVKMSMDADTGFEWNRVLAMSLISIIPSLIVFLLAQDQFIDGIAAGGVKG